MPCYLFTYHAYGSWMPDDQRGFVKRGQGILPPDGAMARSYRTAMKEPEVTFTERIQLAVVQAIVQSRDKQRFECYYVATDATHIHVLVAWRDERAWKRMRSITKSSMSRFLNKAIVRREWFVEGGSRKRVRERRHLDYLISTYLPRHNGWKWSPERGAHR